MQEHPQCCPRCWGQGGWNRVGVPGGLERQEGKGQVMLLIDYLREAYVAPVFTLHSFIVHLLGTTSAGGTVLGPG